MFPLFVKKSESGYLGVGVGGGGGGSGTPDTTPLGYGPAPTSVDLSIYKSQYKGLTLDFLW